MIKLPKLDPHQATLHVSVAEAYRSGATRSFNVFHDRRLVRDIHPPSEDNPGMYRVNCWQLQNNNLLNLILLPAEVLLQVQPPQGMRYWVIWEGSRSANAVLELVDGICFTFQEATDAVQAMDDFWRPSEKVEIIEVEGSQPTGRYWIRTNPDEAFVFAKRPYGYPLDEMRDYSD